MYYSVDCGVFLNLTIQPAWLKTVIDVFFELLCRSNKHKKRRLKYIGKPLKSMVLQLAQHGSHKLIA